MATDVSPAGMRRSKARALLGCLPSCLPHAIPPGRPGGGEVGRTVLVCEGLLILAAALLSFSRLDCPLQEPEETLYAEVPRQMMAEGRFLVPVRHGEAYYDKPPLLYWLVMGVYRLCGVHDWAARLVPSGATFLCVLAAYGWARRTAGPRAAFAGALMLCLSARYEQMARMVTTNALLTLCVTAALAAAHQALAGPAVRRRWWLLSAVACGLGLLTKGPVALVLVAVPVLLYQFLDRRGVRSTVWLWTVYGAVAGAVAVPWFVAVSIRDPSFVDYFFWTHHVRRFVDPFNHVQPWWYYLPLLAMAMMPWTLLLPWLVLPLLRGVRRGLPSWPGPLGFFLLAGLWSLVFFSASGCKRPSYILPAMPPLALALGYGVDAACSAGRLRWAHWAFAAAGTFLVLFGAALFLLPGYADKYSLREQIVPHVETSASVPVLSYPHGWDGVSYYLQRNDVRVFRHTQLGEMVSALGRQPPSLVVVKSDASLDSFLAALPGSLEFVPCSSRPPVAVGWVRRR